MEQSVNNKGWFLCLWFVLCVHISFFFCVKRKMGKKGGGSSGERERFVGCMNESDCIHFAVTLAFLHDNHPGDCTCSTLVAHLYSHTPPPPPTPPFSIPHATSSAWTTRYKLTCMRMKSTMKIQVRKIQNYCS